jgi:hypothetical protein
LAILGSLGVLAVHRSQQPICTVRGSVVPPTAGRVTWLS